MIYSGQKNWMVASTPKLCLPHLHDEAEPMTVKYLTLMQQPLGGEPLEKGQPSSKAAAHSHGAFGLQDCLGKSAQILLPRPRVNNISNRHQDYP